MMRQLTTVAYTVVSRCCYLVSTAAFGMLARLVHCAAVVKNRSLLRFSASYRELAFPSLIFTRTHAHLERSRVKPMSTMAATDAYRPVSRSNIVVRWSTIVMLLGGVSSFAPTNVKKSSRRTSVRAPKIFRMMTASEQQQEAQDTFVLPVFPLRKSVRIPPEALTLNLYEPRYLQLAEYVLDSNPPWFGAMFSSKKPQFISQGDGPIVPMVEAGDIGAVCCVLYDEDAMVPVSRDDVHGPLRRRIKLKGLAIGRFRIERVLHNGYGGGIECEKDQNIEPLPFILVEASRIDDIPETDDDDDDDEQRELEKEIYALIRMREGLREQMITNLWGDLILLGDESYNGEEDDLVARSFETLLPSHLREGGSSDTASTNETQRLDAIENAIDSWVMDSSITIEDQQRQIFSFAVSSAALPEMPASDSMLLLKGISTNDRLRYAYNELQKSQSWLSIFSSLL